MHADIVSRYCIDISLSYILDIYATNNSEFGDMCYFVGFFFLRLLTSIHERYFTRVRYCEHKVKETKCFPSVLLNVKQVFHQLTLISNRVVCIAFSKMERESDKKRKPLKEKELRVNLRHPVRNVWNISRRK